MTILTVQFDRGSSSVYRRLLDAFRRSVEDNMPEAKFEVLKMEAPTGDTRGRWGFFTNTEKLWAWYEYMKSCSDEIIFADCDMIMRRSAEEAFDVPFDIAYTRRTGRQRIPINNGIIMARPTEAAKSFIKRWAEVNQQMYDEPEFHRQWKKTYPGMNQSAFGYLLETGEHEAHLHEYGTRKWNAVEVDWEHLEEDTVFVHYKGAIRARITSGRCPVDGAAEAILLWHRYGGVPPALSEKARQIVNGIDCGGRRTIAHSEKVRRALLKHAGFLEELEMEEVADDV